MEAVNRPGAILALNVGSSSLKAALYDDSDGLLWSKKADWKAGDSLASLLGELPARPTAVGHRLVHGGPSLTGHCPLDDHVIARLRQDETFAPEHIPNQVAAMEEARKALGPPVFHFLVVDTAFHSTMPREASAYGGPRDWWNQGLRRYGFHGINHQYVAGRAAQMLNRSSEGLRLVSCHLGNGASLAAIRDGRSIDTTMGFTPLEGLVMGTRSGTLDPALVLYLIRQGNTPDGLAKLLNKESGLKGLSGLSGDMREVSEAAAQGHEGARFALAVYEHRLLREAGGMIAVLGGLDALIFTGGVGENQAELRQRLCRSLGFLPMQIHPELNRTGAGDRDVASEDSPIRILIIGAQEELAIARECRRLLAEPAKL